jgi:Flp pilus assembly protein TadG
VTGRGWRTPFGRMRVRQAESGQATVELALTLPFVALLLLAVVQVILIGRSQLALQNGVREAARSCAVDPGCDASGIVQAATGSPANVDLSIGTDVVVAADADVPVIVPGLSRLTLSIDARAVMRFESP